MSSAATLYQITLGLHAVFAISFLGVAGANSVIGPLAKKNPQHAVFALTVTRKLYETAVFPGAAGIFITGLYMSMKGDFGSDDVWLTIGVLLYFVMIGLALFVLYPACKTALRELETQQAPGPPSELFQKSAAKMGKIGPFMGIMMMIVAFLMAAQPF